MKCIEIGFIDPKTEQNALLTWAQRVDSGEVFPEPTPMLNFASFSQLHDTLTAKRMELLRFIGQHEGLGIDDLARQTHNEATLLQEEINQLIELGLLELKDGILSTPYDEIVMHYSLREAA